MISRKRGIDRMHVCVCLHMHAKERDWEMGVTYPVRIPHFFEVERPNHIIAHQEKVLERRRGWNRSVRSKERKRTKEEEKRRRRKRGGSYGRNKLRY